MSYEDTFNALARNLSRLLIAEEPVPPADLASAADAHAATVALLTQLHRDITGILAPGRSSTAEELDRHPVAALGRLLADHPRRWYAAPTDIALTPAVTAAGQLWRDVGRHATLAHHAWVTSSPDSRPTGDAAWSALADLAALAEAAATLDPDLARAMTTTGRHDDATNFSAAAVSGIRVAAAESRSLATAGPLPDVEDVTAARSRPVAVHAAEAVLVAQRRLALLLAQVEDIRPADVERVITTQGRTALIAARLVEDPRLADELREHARVLAAAVDRPQRVASIGPTDPRPLAQARELLRYFAAAAPDSHTSAAAVGFARGVAEVSEALSVVATRQTEQRRWLVPEPDHRPGRPIWTRSGAVGAPEPAMLMPLAAVAGAAVKVSEAAGPPTEGAALARLASRGVPPREALREALTARGCPERPGRVAQRSGPPSAPRPRPRTR